MKYLVIFSLISVCTGLVYGPPHHVPGPVAGTGNTGLEGVLVQLVENGATGITSNGGTNGLGVGSRIKLVATNGGATSGLAVNRYATTLSGVNVAADGTTSSVRTIVTKDIYLHVPPPEDPEEFVGGVDGVSSGRKNYKIIFIKAPSVSIEQQLRIQQEANREEKTLIYVLNKKPDLATEIEDARRSLANKNKPEVFFIKYKTRQAVSAPTLSNGVTGNGSGSSGGLFQLIGTGNGVNGAVGTGNGGNFASDIGNGNAGNGGSGDLFQLVNAGLNGKTNGNGGSSFSSTYNSPPANAAGDHYKKK